MYYYGGGSCGCQNQNWGMPWWGCCGGNSGYGNGSNYAIILVLFILLVIVIGSRFVR